MVFQFSSLGFDKEHQDCAKILVNLPEDETPRKYGQAIRKGNDYPTSSTPAHRLDDSGYHSIQRNATFTTSIKRSFFEREEDFRGNISPESPQKLLHEDQLNSSISQISKFYNDLLPKCKVVECLRFELSPDPVSSSNAKISNPAKKLKLFPQSSDCITELHKQNYYSILTNMFSYLSGKDLTSASVVCHTWNEAIYFNPNSRNRKSVYLQERKQVAKENLTPHYSVPPEKGVIRAGILEDVLNLSHMNNKMTSKTKCDIINVPSLQTPCKPILKQKCPACAFACEIRAATLKTMCRRKTCQYEFCAKCFGPYNQKHICTLITSTEYMHKIVLCSKKCKKNLRRL